MKCLVGRKWLGLISALLGVSFLVPCASARDRKDHPYRYSDIDMPVSLAVGTVRTPEFTVVKEWYDIMVQVEIPLPYQQLRCMMGVTAGALESIYCSSDDPLL